VTANAIWLASAAGNSDQSKATVPVTNGAAALVPLSIWDPPVAPRLVTLFPGAIRPFVPIERPRFDFVSGRP